MKKIRAFFYVFYKSLTSFMYYRDIIRADLRFSIKYFTVLALIAALITSVTVSVTAVPKLQKGIDTAMADVLDSFPDNLIITIKDSKFNVNQPEPYAIPLPKSFVGEDKTEEGKMKNIIVFDSQGTIEDLEKYNTLALINATNILVRNQGKIEVYPLKDFPDGQFSKGDIVQLVDKVRPYMIYLPHAVITLVLIASLLYFSTFKVAYLAFMGLLLFGVGRGRKLNISYTRALQVAIHSMTLPLLIEVLATSAQVQISLPFWFFILNFVFGMIAIFKISNDSFLPVIKEANSSQ